MRCFFLMSLKDLCFFKTTPEWVTDTKLLFPAARATFLPKQCANTHGRQKSTSTRSHSHFQSPLKNVIFTVGVKAISKISLPRCMRSKKNVPLTEHGKHIFEFCNTSAVKRMVSKWHFYRRGVSKIENRALPLHEEQKKKCFSRSMGSVIFIFATPLE